MSDTNCKFVSLMWLARHLSAPAIFRTVSRALFQISNFLSQLSYKQKAGSGCTARGYYTL